jgi:hypothetical protein
MIKIKLIVTSLVLALGLSSIAYAKNDKEKKLPPGLQKKVGSGKSLPPGWQKKVAVGRVLDQDVYEQGKILLSHSDKGFVTISVEGQLIRVIENTREIVEILDGF